MPALGTVNTTVLAGRIVSKSPLRVTPGGVPMLELMLHHQSIQAENGRDVQVEVEMNAVAYGEVAKDMQQLLPGDTVSLKGFLSRRNRYANAMQLHITQFKTEDSR